MGQYVRKHRRALAWSVFPTFIVILLGILSLSVFPGWIRPAFSTIGDSCVGLAVDSSDPLLTACDQCRGEFCNASTVGATGTCDLGFFALSFPQCQCSTTFSSINFGQTQVFFPIVTFGGPSDSFCQNISGGAVENSCRDATCTTNTTFDTSNPTGCDFEFDPNNAQCSDCLFTGADSCGNGICEQDLGESFDDCPVDCRVPGFPFATPLPEGDPILNTACEPRGPRTITFGGNIENSGTCEDGDICTTNTCQGGVPAAGIITGFCDIEPAGCSGNTSDLCCPTGCNPAPDGTGTCNSELDPGCDVDCLPDCGGGIPTPPPTVLEISGTSLVCSLADRGPDTGLNGAASLLSLALGLASLVAWRAKKIAG